MNTDKTFKRLLPKPFDILGFNFAISSSSDAKISLVILQQGKYVDAWELDAAVEER
jgi:hypothetical protein